MNVCTLVLSINGVFRVQPFTKQQCLQGLRSLNRPAFQLCVIFSEIGSRPFTKKVLRLRESAHLRSSQNQLLQVFFHNFCKVILITTTTELEKLRVQPTTLADLELKSIRCINN